ncbi:MAG: hypothetical protein WCK51_05645 [Armatimonadota bacterium]
MSVKLRFSKPLQVVLGISAALMALLGIAYALTDIPSAASKFKENEAKAKAAGLFTSSEEFLATLEVPTNENGATLMKMVLDEFTKNYESRKLFELNQKSLNTPLITASYQEFDPFWKQVDQAAKLKYCIFPRNRKPLINAEYPELATLKSVVKFASLRADVAVEQNQPQVAAEAWRRAANVALVADDEPTLIGLLVRIAGEAIVEESMRKALNRRGQDPALRAAAWQTLQLLDQPLDFARTMKTEHVFALEGFDSLARAQTNLNEEWMTEDGNRLIRTYSKIPRAKLAANSRIHEIYAEFYTRLGSDPYDSKKIENASNWMDRELESKNGLSYILPKILMPVFSQAGKACSKTYAQRNVLMQAIKLLENPTQRDLPLKGRYALDSDGKPLRLTWDKNQRIIYSIGPNFKDDGGVIERPKSGGSLDYDYGVAIPK